MLNPKQIIEWFDDEGQKHTITFSQEKLLNNKIADLESQKIDFSLYDETN